jgi:hypothetical protein
MNEVEVLCPEIEYYTLLEPLLRLRRTAKRRD